MRKENVLTNTYMRDNEHFADAVNYHVFGGRQKIAPEDLRELDTREDVVIEDETGKVIMTAEKFRDLLKLGAVKSTDSPECVYVILGIENQTETSYFAPPTAMMYDGMNYWSQRSKLWARHKKEESKKEIRPGEFLSRFLETDRLIPVLTLFVHWNSKPWTGFRELHEMFRTEYPRELLEKIPNYSINLISPSDIHDFSAFSSEFGKVMNIVAAEEKGDQLQKIAEDRLGEFRHISKEAMQVVNAVTGFGFRINSGEEGTDVCKGAKEYIYRVYKDELQKKDNVIQERDSVIQERDSVIREKDVALQEKDSFIAKVNDLLREKDQEIEALRKQVQMLQGMA